MRTCKQRPNAIVEYKAQLPNLIEIFDEFEIGNTSILNMKKALLFQLENKLNAIQMEDDVILCTDFQAKCFAEISKRPTEVINFFSMRKDDILIGSRYIKGYKYLMNQCFYLPLETAKLVLNCFDEFESIRTDNRIGGTDSLIQYTLKKYKLSYWNVVPNLVDHKVAISAIDKRRSSKRQSLTFQPR